MSYLLPVWHYHSDEEMAKDDNEPLTKASHRTHCFYSQQNVHSHQTLTQDSTIECAAKYKYNSTKETTETIIKICSGTKYLSEESYCYQLQ